MTRAIDLLCMGEPMYELAETMRDGERLMLPGFGGDALNVAVAASRQGARVAVFTALGGDVFGERFLSLWDEEGIDRHAVIVRPAGRTAVYFITYGPDGHEFSYLRAGSAASELTQAEVPVAAIAASSVLLVSAIGQAISASACDAVFAAITAARQAGTEVCYDTNYRPRLWPLDRARAIIAATAAQATILRPSLDDARVLTGLSDPDAVADHYLRAGAPLVALTLGAAGCLLATAEQRHRVPGLRVAALDPSGAGDTFTGAFLAEYLRGGDLVAAGRYANAAAALQTLGRGCVVPMPRREAVMAALAGA